MVLLNDTRQSEPPSTNTGPFLRGDCDNNGRLSESTTDALALFGFVFRGKDQPECLAACDAEANGVLNITDGLRILQFLFLGKKPPDPPFPACASSDEETDAIIGCETPFCP